MTCGGRYWDVMHGFEAGQAVGGAAAGMEGGMHTSRPMPSPGMRPIRRGRATPAIVAVVVGLVVGNAEVCARNFCQTETAIEVGSSSGSPADVAGARSSSGDLVRAGAGASWGTAGLPGWKSERPSRLVSRPVFHLQLPLAFTLPRAVHFNLNMSTELSREEQEKADKELHAREAKEQAALPYKWTQTIKDVDVTVPVPGNIKGRDLDVVLTKSKLKVALKGQTPLIDVRRAPHPVTRQLD